MYIKNLKLIGFRNYLQADLNFQSAKTIIIGKNAQGKTNLLEVIQVLSHLKSRRAKRDAELVNFDLKEAVIKAQVCKSQEDKNDDLALLVRKSGRRTLKINEVSKKPKELLHHVFSVSFMVDDLSIINSSPSIRRDYLNYVNNQLRKNYAEALDEFEKNLAQRNQFLKDLCERGLYRYSELNQTQKEQLSLWDEIYIDKANKLTELRKDFINSIQPIAASYYQKIAGNNDELQLEYTGLNINREDLETIRDKDFARSYTNIGPHRDEIAITLNNKAAAGFCSQGERRTIILALKLAELELLKNIYQESPILLLDDVLAELDEDRQDFLLDHIDEQTQVIITTTHLGKHLEKWSQNAQIIEVENGTLKYFNEVALI